MSSTSQYGQIISSAVLSDVDKEAIKEIVNFIIGKEKASSEQIENHVIDLFEGFDKKRVRSLLYKMEDNLDIIASSILVVPTHDRPNNKVCYYRLLDIAKKLTRRKADDIVDSKVDFLIQQYKENQVLYYCPSCKYIYTFAMMFNNDGKCKNCEGQVLAEMEEEMKEQAICDFLSSLPPDVNRERIEGRIYSELSDVMTFRYIIPPVDIANIKVAFDENITRSVPSGGDMICLDDAIDMLMWVKSSHANRLLFEGKPGESFFRMKETEKITEEKEEDEVPPVKQPEAKKTPKKMPYMSVEEINSMDPERLMKECLRRWIVATKEAMDYLLAGSQRESRKKTFTLSKLFLFDSMGKKYLSIALTGKETRKINRNLGKVFDLLSKNRLMRICSYHPKFEPAGVETFIDMCKNGEVYRYEKYKEEIINAAEYYFSVNEKR